MRVMTIQQPLPLPCLQISKFGQEINTIITSSIQQAYHLHPTKCTPSIHPPSVLPPSNQPTSLPPPYNKPTTSIQPAYHLPPTGLPPPSNKPTISLQPAYHLHPTKRTPSIQQAYHLPPTSLLIPQESLWGNLKENSTQKMVTYPPPSSSVNCKVNLITLVPHWPSSHPIVRNCNRQESPPDKTT